MFTIGDDFQWEAARDSFRNWDDVIAAVNNDGRLQVLRIPLSLYLSISLLLSLTLSFQQGLFEPKLYESSRSLVFLTRFQGIALCCRSKSLPYPPRYCSMLPFLTLFPYPLKGTVQHVC